jgi:hypothetical protein
MRRERAPIGNASANLTSTPVGVLLLKASSSSPTPSLRRFVERLPPYGGGAQIFVVGAENVDTRRILCSHMRGGIDHLLLVHHVLMLRANAA